MLKEGVAMLHKSSTVFLLGLAILPQLVYDRRDDQLEVLFEDEGVPYDGVNCSLYAWALVAFKLF